MDLAASQWGLFTSAQALALGVSRTQVSRMAAGGRVEQMAHGTWHITATGYDDLLGVRAAWLSLLPKKTAWERLKSRPHDAVATGRTAAFLHGDTELHPEPYAFAVGPDRRTARADVRLCAWVIDGRDVDLVGGLPCASVERTVADLVRLREDPSLVDGFARGAASRGLRFDEGRLAELLAPLAARNGYARGDGAAFARDIHERDVLPQRIAAISAEIESALGAQAAERFREEATA